MTTLNEDRLADLAARVSSDDFLVSRQSRVELTSLLNLQNVCSYLCTSPKSFAEMLIRVSSGESVEVHRSVCDAFAACFKDSVFSTRIYEADESCMIGTFLIETLRTPSLSIALTSKVALANLFRLYLLSPNSSLPPLVTAAFKDDMSLRLFDCDNLDSEENTVTFNFLKLHTTLIDEVLENTCRSFEDPLLLSNYLVVCSIFARCDSSALSGELESKIEAALQHPDDELIWMSVSRFCTSSLHKSESVAKRYASKWVKILSSLVLNAATEAVTCNSYDTFASACSTATGGKVLSEVGVSRAVKLSLCNDSSDTAVALSALHYTFCFYKSPFSKIDTNLEQGMKEAWRLRSSLDVEVRMLLWQAIIPMIGCHAFPLVNACASFLCSCGVDDTCVKQHQLQVAEMLLLLEDLPSVYKEGLDHFIRRGLHPPGSAGVALMSRD